MALDSSLHVVAEDSDDEQHEQSNGNGDRQENGHHFEPLSVMFGSAVDALCWSPCGNFVLAGLRAGSAQLVHIPSRKPLTAMAVPDAEPDPEQRQRCFVGCSIRVREGGASILLIGRNGKVNIQRDFFVVMSNFNTSSRFRSRRFTTLTCVDWVPPSAKEISHL
jgi:hypothetical protein